MSVNDMSHNVLSLEVPINIQDLLPLREPTFYILLSLAHREKHGYAILKDIESFSEGKVKMSNGTLYGALTRLLDQGLISRLSSDSDPGSNRPRKIYSITDLGLSVLNAEVARMNSLVKKASLHLAEDTQ